MNAQTEKRLVPGPAGQIEIAIDLPADGAAPVGTALICHPNPTQGGTMDNKVVQTLARAFIQLARRALQLPRHRQVRGRLGRGARRGR
jgi:alpha/beta superfamily hydrolase